MEALTMGVNWLAVIVGFIAAFGLGWLWYSPILFYKKWAEGCRIDTNQPVYPMWQPMLAQVVGTFLLAWVVGITATTDSFILALFITAAIAVLIKANGLFGQKSAYAIMVESGYVLAMVAVMIIAQALF